MADYLLGIDSGLTVTKAVLFDSGGRVVAVGRRAVPRIQPRARHVERDMAALWRESAAAIRDAIAQAGVAPGAVAAIGVTGHGDGLYLLGDDLAPLGNAIVSLDTRAAEVLDGWRADGTMAAALRATGQQPYAAAPAALLAWLRRHEPERYGRIRWVLSCKDWLRFCLAGAIATDLTEASVSFTDYRSQTYSDEAFALYGLPAMARATPEMLAPAAVAGQVTAAAAAMTGLAAGTPVVAGLHDVTASAIGSGVAETGRLSIVAGTFSINQVFSDRPQPSTEWYCRSGFARSLWLNMAISPASSANIDWMVRTLCPDAVARAAAEGGTAFDHLEPEIAAAFAGDSTVVYHPFLYGSPHGDDATAGFLGVQGWHDRGHLIRALYEGVVFNHRTHVDALRSAFPMTSARLCGGGARSSRLCQLFADTLGLDIEVVDAEETGALGAALCAAVGVGRYGSLAEASAAAVKLQRRYRSDPARAADLDARYARYRGSIDAVAPIWKSLRGQ
ncbi:MAG: FGGY-family carbohydrate kinase [Alphaproteobacteria bacterium]